MDHTSLCIIKISQQKFNKDKIINSVTHRGRGGIVCFVLVVNFSSKSLTLFHQKHIFLDIKF